jgi:uncharacterized protein YjdB
MRSFWCRTPLVLAVLLGSACGVTDTDEPTPVDTVIVTPPTLEVMAGASGALDAEITDGAGNVLRDRRVVWASANPDIATVSENGIVSGVSAGHVDIAATAEGKSGVAVVTVVAVPARVATVRIVPNQIDLVVATGTNLVATPYDNRGTPIPGRSVVWTTNNASVAAISQTGRVTGLVPGTAVITAVIDGVGGNADVAVTLAPVAKVVVTPAGTSVAVSKTVTLSARLTDAVGNVLSGRTISWSSADTRVATVNGAGVVRGVRRGTAVITATSEGRSGTSTISVE